jgi:ribose transport system permease protein
LGHHISSWGIYAVLVIAFLLGALFVPNFANPENIRNIVQHSVVLGLVSLGMTFAIIGGSLDLSVGVAISCIAVLVSLVISGRTEMMLPAVIIALAAGMAIGLVNGLIITKLKVNPFIATLGTMLVLEGALFSQFDNFAGRVPSEFEFLGYGMVGPIPIGVLLLLAMTLGAHFLLRFSKFGYHLYGRGGDALAARLSGVRTDRVLIWAHVLTGLGGALAAVFIVSRLRTAAPWVGQGLELDSIAAVVVGGAPLSGGRGSVWGTIAGVLILSILNNVFNILNVGAFAQDVIRGMILIAVVAVYSAGLRK